MDAQPPAQIEWIEDDLSDDLRARIKAELEPGERLVWADRAIRAQTKQNTSLINLALWFLGGLGVFGLFLAYVTGLFGTPPKTGSEVPVLGIVAVISALVGLGTGIALAVAIVDRVQARRPSSWATYALTDRRAILWSPREGTKAVEVFTFPGQSLLGLHRIEYPDGSGDVLFQEEKRYPWDSRGFLGIADVRRVESLARPILVDPDPRRTRQRAEDSDPN